jgi:hypothetical protein
MSGFVPVPIIAARRLRSEGMLRETSVSRPRPRRWHSSTSARSGWFSSRHPATRWPDAPGWPL